MLINRIVGSQAVACLWHYKGGCSWKSGEKLDRNTLNFSQTSIILILFFNFSVIHLKMKCCGIDTLCITIYMILYSKASSSSKICLNVVTHQASFLHCTYIDTYPYKYCIYLYTIYTYSHICSLDCWCLFMSFALHASTSHIIKDIS